MACRMVLSSICARNSHYAVTSSDLSSSIPKARVGTVDEFKDSSTAFNAAEAIASMPFPSLYAFPLQSCRAVPLVV